MISKVRAMGMRTVVLFGMGAAAGCAGSSASARPSGTASSAVVDAESASLMEHHRYHHHAGVTLFIAMSLDTLGVSPEQRDDVEKIRSRLYDAMEPARAADRNLLNVLADGLDAASFDATKVDAAVTQVADVSGASHEASTAALNDLHAALTPPQRAALVDKVASHWAVWQRENDAEVDSTSGAGERGHLAALTIELGLRPDQVEKIRGPLADRLRGAPRIDPQQIAAHVRAFGDAFRGETFDARTLATGTAANVRLVSWGAVHLVHVVEAMSPVLDPGQRATLAQKLREHAIHNPGARERS
jgi:Spy/CpxP family protein refolding chaperone